MVSQSCIVLSVMKSRVFLTDLPEVVDDGEGHEEGVIGSPGDEAAHPHHQVQAPLKTISKTLL